LIASTQNHERLMAGLPILPSPRALATVMEQ
jgi:hypothetical protein